MAWHGSKNQFQEQQKQETDQEQPPIPAKLNVEFSAMC